MHKRTHRTESDKERIAKETVSKSDKEQTYVAKLRATRKMYSFHQRGHLKPI